MSKADDFPDLKTEAPPTRTATGFDVYPYDTFNSHGFGFSAIRIQYSMSGQ